MRKLHNFHIKKFVLKKKILLVDTIRFSIKLECFFKILDAFLSLSSNID